MKKILLIEDDEVKAQDIINFIDTNKYMIEKTSSITMGLRHISALYDIILLDMSLPRFQENALKNYEPFGGIEIIKEIERKRIQSDIIIITQYSLFGEGALSKTLDEIKQQCMEYQVNLKDVIKYSKDDAEWKNRLNLYL